MSSFKSLVLPLCHFFVAVNEGSVLVSDSPNTGDYVPQSEDFEADKLRYVHPEKDFISLLSCTPGGLKVKLYMNLF